MPTHCFKCAVTPTDTFEIELYPDGHSDVTVHRLTRDEAICVVLSSEDTDRLRDALVTAHPPAASARIAELEGALKTAADRFERIAGRDKLGGRPKAAEMSEAWAISARAALAPAERVEAVPDARGLLHEAWSVLLTYSRAPVWNEERQKTAEKIRLALGVDAHGVMQPAPTRAGALDAAGVIEKTRDRLVEAVEAWGDGRDAGRVYNVRQTAVMKALNAYLDAKAALAAADVNK